MDVEMHGDSSGEETENVEEQYTPLPPELWPEEIRTSLCNRKTQGKTLAICQERVTPGNWATGPWALGPWVPDPGPWVLETPRSLKP